MDYKVRILLLLAATSAVGRAADANTGHHQASPASNDGQLAASSCDGNVQAATDVLGQIPDQEYSPITSQQDPVQCGATGAEQLNARLPSADKQHDCQNPQVIATESRQTVGQAGQKALLEALLHEAGGTSNDAASESDSSDDNIERPDLQVAAPAVGLPEQPQVHKSRSIMLWEIGSRNGGHKAIGRKLAGYTGQQYTSGFPMLYTVALSFESSSVQTNPKVVKLSDPVMNNKIDDFDGIPNDPVVAAFGAGLLASMIPILSEYYMTAQVQSYVLGNPIKVTVIMYTNMNVGMQKSTNNNVGSVQDPAERLESLDHYMVANNGKESPASRLTGLLSSQNATTFVSDYDLTDVAVQSSATNEASIAACDSYVSRTTGNLWGGDWTPIKTAMVVVIPTVALLVLAVRLFTRYLAKRRARAFATAAPGVTLGPMSIGVPMHVPAPPAAAVGNSAYRNGSSSNNYSCQALGVHGYQSQRPYSVGTVSMQQQQQQQQQPGCGAPAASYGMYQQSAHSPGRAAVTSPFAASAQQQGTAAYGWQGGPSAPYGKY